MSFALPSFAVASDWQYIFGQGQVALSKEKLPEAESHFRLSLSYAKKANDADEIEKSRTKLADVLVLRNKTAEAQKLYLQILSRVTAKYGNTKKIVPTLMALGSIQESIGNHTAAITYYQRALKINEKNFGPYSPAFADNLHALGRANSKIGKKGIAATQYKQAMSILMKDPSLNAGTKLQSVMHDYSDLISTDDDSDKSLLKDFDKEILKKTKVPTPVSVDKSPPPSSQWQMQGSALAETSHQEKLDKDSSIATRALNQPFSNSTLAPAYRIINQSIADNGRTDMGEDYYERMVAVDLKALGANHPSVGNDLNGLAQLYIRQKEYEKAEPVIKQAYEIYQTAYGMDNLLTISSGAAYAFVEFRLGNLAHSTELYGIALGHSQKALGPNNFETARILNEMAYLYFHQGKLQEAQTYYKWAIASTEAAVGADNPLLAACLKDYAKVLKSLGDTTEAAAVELRATGILVKVGTASVP